MKSIILIIALLMIGPVDWLTDFEQAKARARERHQFILLNFSGSDWCAPCIRMKKEIFDTGQFRDFAAANLVLVRADFPRHKKNQLDPMQQAHNEKLAERFNPDGKFPFTILLDSGGTVIHAWDGYSNIPVDVFLKELQSRIHGK